MHILATTISISAIVLVTAYIYVTIKHHWPRISQALRGEAKSK